jgi:hypothetical protein
MLCIIGPRKPGVRVSEKPLAGTNVRRNPETKFLRSLPAALNQRARDWLGKRSSVERTLPPRLPRKEITLRNAGRRSCSQSFPGPSSSRQSLPSPPRLGRPYFLFYFISIQRFFVLPWLVISQISFHAWQTLEPRLVTRWVRGVVWSAALLIGAGLGPSGRKNKNNWQISSYIHYIHAADGKPTNYNSAYLKP